MTFLRQIIVCYISHIPTPYCHSIHNICTISPCYPLPLHLLTLMPSLTSWLARGMESALSSQITAWLYSPSPANIMYTAQSRNQNVRMRKMQMLTLARKFLVSGFCRSVYCASFLILPIWHLAMKSLFSFQPSGLSRSAWRKWSIASGRLAEGGEAKRVEAIFRSIHESWNKVKGDKLIVKVCSSSTLCSTRTPTEVVFVLLVYWCLLPNVMNSLCWLKASPAGTTTTQHCSKHHHGTNHQSYSQQAHKTHKQCISHLTQHI